MLISQDWVKSLDIFSEEGFTEENITDSPAGTALKNLLLEIRNFSQRFLFLYVTVQDGQNGGIYSKLIEDKSSCLGFVHSYGSFYEVFFKGISKVF